MPDQAKREENSKHEVSPASTAYPCEFVAVDESESLAVHSNILPDPEVGGRDVGPWIVLLGNSVSLDQGAVRQSTVVDLRFFDLYRVVLRTGARYLRGDMAQQSVRLQEENCANACDLIPYLEVVV